jgi:hypothetical protein
MARPLIAVTLFPRGIMSALASRQSFANFLSHLAAGSEAEGAWFEQVITHYRDEELEEIRRALVRLGIKRNRTGRVDAWQPEDRAQMLRWAEQLGR